MSGWPPITEPELLDRLAMDDRQFEEFIRALVARVPPRAFDAASLERAVGYPWTRPAGSFLLTSAGVELLGDLSTGERERLLAEYLSDAGGRLAVLAIGSNAAPETLERKFAHFPEDDDRAVMALTGRLHDFDVGVAAQPALYGSMPATLFPSMGTAVSATVLWVTPAQFTQLAWSELSYRLGRLRTRFDVDHGDRGFDEVLVFVSRFGAFCVDGRPVALAPIPASGRSPKRSPRSNCSTPRRRLPSGRRKCGDARTCDLRGNRQTPPEARGDGAQGVSPVRIGALDPVQPGASAMTWLSARWP